MKTTNRVKKENFERKNFRGIEESKLLKSRWGTQVLLRPVYSGWEHLSKMSMLQPLESWDIANSKKLQEKPIRSKIKLTKWF
jgi:hypothetical protein